ncbi:MAG TPA: diguanylate cyclase [Thermoleophilaceae bacterium]|nr:diguanylate cyclase [Thermoleophilaceae bacterium]
MRGSAAVAAAAFVLYAGLTLLIVCGSTATECSPVTDFTELYVYNALIAAAAAFCLARARHVERERGAWLAFGLGLAAWAAGEAAYTLFLDGPVEPGHPNVSDVLWLLFYPATYVGIVLLVRARVNEFRASLWLDGVVGALAMASIGAALALGPVTSGGDGMIVALDLIFLLGDLLLLGFVVGALALTGWRPDRTWVLLGAGLVMAAVVDGFFLWQAATGATAGATLATVLWPGSTLLVGAAAWQSPAARPVRAEGWRLLAMPTAFAVAAVGVLIYDLARPVDAGALGLAMACLLAVILRMSVTVRENHDLLEGSRREALTDALTGLSNRRRLMLDLEREVRYASTSQPCALALFDLDGFKQYNDRFGHPVGDALLARLGRKLADAVGDEGVAYRLGGDEFCVVAPLGELAAGLLAETAREALTDRGRGFEVGASCGMVIIPEEATDVSSALRLADQRLYREKGEGRRSVVSRQTSDALLQVLKECEPGLDGHLQVVAALAREVGSRLGVTGSELDELTRAAELHDVGKVALPASILRKPGPLDESEWSFVRQHTLVGDRILSAAPALSSLAHVVRASHEHFDGSGYPDGVAGEDIPLAARVVAVCDAYHAMTSDRPYRTALAHWEALEELRRCAGRQFDPVVVAAFRELMESASEGAHTAQVA